MERDAAGRFPKGVSGNPGGRVKGLTEITRLARQYTEEAIATLYGIMMNGGKDSDRVSAAQVIIDRGWGKAPQSVELTSEEGGGLNVVLNVIRSGGSKSSSSSETEPSS